MARWRLARDAGLRLAPDVQAELDSLVDAELRAATERAAAIGRETECLRPTDERR